jgi:hypothetical protein
MIDLLLQLAYVALVLAVISLFVCTLPVWLIHRAFTSVISLHRRKQMDTIQTLNGKFPNRSQEDWCESRSTSAVISVILFSS